ncbi:TPA: rhodanese-related sulfurtransferase [Legionella pneumophila]|uniref:tRNA uridine(34) hydroxylase n=1 Tax=Legionella pneumophila subsp. pneumophila TaxID=91891 RepID=A0A3A6U2F3_LEGPN|nr:MULTISPECIES: rhodanese-related sulfurtransferase [Legionella]HAT7809667.1 rhodanese-related sulfurtransferase [Legionella pneumophila]MBN5936140.1 rhodanese-related sulfurtransferase [Legionella anisa]RJY24205.1 rhodanese-related sulfurtransferase [Legionella pneumophila subsp. pneumophila]RJY24653.1 rhodanese-related sulfurtransferase [Legionella pneumophila subsp. pneumophila]HAT7819297.1 rhodanese-related sulfurtransferase [Legionella pneumophila]
MSYVVSALYKFVSLSDYRQLREPLLSFMKHQAIRGTLLLAQEGINGTVAGRREAIDALYAWFEKHPSLKNIVYKESFCQKIPFNRTRVKLKKEIVTMGVEGVSPSDIVGTYVKPEEWNALISADDVTVIDTRNDYEIQIGTFKNAMNPKTSSFREFPQFVADNLSPQTHKKVAMYCTGGIRCEKSTAYLKMMGFEEVYHLEGGILKYLEEVPETESLWEGECFVFDERVAVNHSLEKGSYSQCYACRLPITENDKRSKDYVQGVSCPHCVSQHSETQKQRHQEREKQNQLAKARGETHIGGDVAGIIKARKQIKECQRKNGLSE